MPYILVVEDDVDARGILVLALQDAGFKTLGAANGLEALNFICDPKRTTRPYLILLDLNMPVMNGRQLINVFERCDKMSQIPLVITSAEDDIPEGYRFLKKPLSIRDVIEIAHQAHALAPVKQRTPTLKEEGG